MCVAEDTACFADVEGCGACLEAADMMGAGACSDPQDIDTCSEAAKYFCCTVGEDCSGNPERIGLLSESSIDCGNLILLGTSAHAFVRSH